MTQVWSLGFISRVLWGASKIIPNCSITALVKNITIWDQDYFFEFLFQYLKQVQLGDLNQIKASQIKIKTK